MESKDLKDFPVIFNYTDFRGYLQDYFAWEKTHRSRFSLRSFSASVAPGLSSSSFLSAVLKGKKNIGPSLRARFIQALHFKQREGQYFDLLVQFNQSTSMTEKGQLFAQLSRFNHSRAKLIYENQFRFFTKWYYLVIWNYFGVRQRVGSLNEIANAIIPRLTAAQVQESIKLLLDLGLIKKLANGYSVTQKHLATEPEFRGLEAIPLSEMFLNLAGGALHSINPLERKFGTLVFSASAATFSKIKEKMAAFHDEVQDLVDKDDKPEGVFTFSFQLFPNSRLESPLTKK